MTLTTTTTTPTYEQQNQTHQMRKNPMTVFTYALKAPESRRQYPRRLKIFLDYLGLEGSLEDQAELFYPTHWQRDIHFRSDFTTGTSEPVSILSLYLFTIYIIDVRRQE
ncbi:MAG: hypothetical protein WCA61_02515 [Nitrososphaeraceae archaeon]